MRVAITGSTGMIGSELARILTSAGNEVISIVRPGSKKMGNLPDSDLLEIIECNLPDYERIFNTNHCDVFYHLAWMNTFGDKRDDVEIQSKNISYALDAVRLAHSWGATKFIGAGSQAEYGHSDIKLNGDLPVNPTSGYGVAKFAAGRLCSLACKQFNIGFNWARILSVYGELDANHTLIMYLIRSFLNKEIPELTKCEQIWDYVYSTDAATALAAIGENGVDGRTYCIGSGSSRTLKEYVEVVRDIVAPGSEIKFGVKDYYPHQAMCLCADIRELTKDTGFEPKFSFEEGIKRTVDYVRSKMSSPTD